MNKFGVEIRRRLLAIISGKVLKPSSRNNGGKIMNYFEDGA